MHVVQTPGLKRDFARCSFFSNNQNDRLTGYLQAYFGDDASVFSPAQDGVLPIGMAPPIIQRFSYDSSSRRMECSFYSESGQPLLQLEDHVPAQVKPEQILPLADGGSRIALFAANPTKGEFMACASADRFTITSSLDVPDLAAVDAKSPDYDQSLGCGCHCHSKDVNSGCESARVKSEGKCVCLEFKEDGSTVPCLDQEEEEEARQLRETQEEQRRQLVQEDKLKQFEEQGAKQRLQQEEGTKQAEQEKELVDEARQKQVDEQGSKKLLQEEQGAKYAERLREQTAKKAEEDRQKRIQ